MAQKEFIYQVARIRAKELALLNTSFINQLISARSYDECIQLLKEKGWGSEGADTLEEMLSEERQKTWALMDELLEDISVLDVLLIGNDYHNLKAAMKQALMDVPYDGIFFDYGTVDLDVIKKAVEENDFQELPDHMREVAAEVYEILLHTGDGQICDVMLDKAALDAIYQAGKKSGNEFLKFYAECTVASCDIKIALRSSRTDKDVKFLRKALAQCDSIDIEKLIQASLDGVDGIADYLLHTEYSDVAEKILESSQAMELWFDNLLIEKMRDQITEPFTIGPLAAYVLARENEIKTVRIILSAKLNDLPEDSVRERVREMYV